MGRQRKADLYLRGTTWWCWFYDHRGKQIRKSTHQQDKELAHAAALLIQHEYFASPPEYERVTVELALARYLAKRERGERAEGTMNQYISKAKHLLRLFGAERSINELRLSHVEHYIDTRLAEIKRKRPDSTRAIATVGKELGLLRSSLRYMAKQRGPDGFKLYRYETDEIFPEGVIGNYKPRDRALSVNEYHALYVALVPERREYLQAFCGLGARDSELYRITPVASNRTSAACASQAQRPKPPNAGCNRRPSSSTCSSAARRSRLSASRSSHAGKTSAAPLSSPASAQAFRRSARTISAAPSPPGKPKQGCRRP